MRLLFIALFSLLFIHCNNSNNTSNNVARSLSETELKLTLEEKECLKPGDYLTGSLGYTPKYKNLLSLKVKALKLDCYITSSATIATFKDIKASVRFISKTGAIVLESQFDIYEFIKPKGKINYKTEIEITNQQFKDIDSYKWSIISADCN